MDLIKKIASGKLGAAIAAGHIIARVSDRGHLGQLRRNMGVIGIIHKQGVVAQARAKRANRLDMGREAIALPVHRGRDGARIEADLVGE